MEIPRGYIFDYVFAYISKHYSIPLIDMHEGPNFLATEITTPNVTDTFSSSHEGSQTSTKPSFVEILASHSMSGATRNADPSQGIILVVVAVAAVLLVVCTMYSYGSAGPGGDSQRRPKVMRSTSGALRLGGDRSRPLPGSRQASDQGDMATLASLNSSPAGTATGPLPAGRVSPLQSDDHRNARQTVSDAPTPTSPSTSHVGQMVDMAPICPTFVVKQRDGLAMEVPLELQPTEQKLHMIITDMETGDVVARAYVSDRREEPGIMLETADGSSVAFLDTKLALLRPGGQVPTNRVALLHRALHGGWNTAGVPYANFTMTRNVTGGTTLLGRRGGLPSQRQPFLRATFDRNGRLVLLEDENNRELATGIDGPTTFQSREAPVMAMRVHQGRDAGLALIVLFAAAKLQ